MKQHQHVLERMGYKVSFTPGGNQGIGFILEWVTFELHGNSFEGCLSR